MCVVGKNPNTANWSSMADDVITRGIIGLGSLFYICGTISNWQWCQCTLKTSGYVFFNALIQLNLTTITPQSQTAHQIFTFSPIAKYLDDIYPELDQPGGIHLKPRYTRHWPERTSVRTVSCSHLLICHHFFYLLVYINVYQCISFHYYQNLAQDLKKIPTPRKNYPVPDPTHFLDTGSDPPPN